MHIASTGTGPVILFLHGFPELWYSRRHQILSLSSVGYRCIAPDLRGYGDSDAPRSVSEYTGLYVVGDLTGLLDSLGIDMWFRALFGDNYYFLRFQVLLFSFFFFL
ncbi:hypothetical protein POTOM_008726 [Populus tomentosa]|uniref:AB hydrolase-1 domain-containing protein n=1 Tax=Populus tomentosa TaxID=118781 RepID=A0A8X8AMS7_POPTO|nr:hypothetical protein POTOM_008726 [Populus tomentosa]